MIDPTPLEPHPAPDSTPADARDDRLVALLVEQRDRWQRGERVRVEAILAWQPALADQPQAVLDLLVNEIVLRQEAGESPDLDEYLCRFPRLAGELRLQLEVERAIQEDALGAASAPPDSQATAVVHPSGAAAPSPHIAGYEILSELGRGGMGVVYQARQVALNRLVALKTILSGAGAGPDELARFRREAEAVARLQHANIVQIYEVGDQGGTAYFSQEYVGGGTLAQKLAAGRQPPQQAAALAETLARAVHCAHQAGIVHRDLKPANVLLTADGTPKIADFGLAKQLDGAAFQTESGAVMGTPAYMAPEQAQGKVKEVGPAADVYALGTILYEMLTGRPPFHGATPLDTMVQVLTEEPVRPSWLTPRLPRDLETICLKCLHKQPERRYASAEDLADDLRRFRNGEPIQARRAGLWERGVKWARRRPTAAALTGLGGLLVLLLAGVGLWYWDAYHRVKVEYHGRMARRWGALEGVQPLTADQVRRRYFSYKFYRRAGRVEKVEVVNGHDLPTTRHNVFAFIDNLCYAPDGKRECRYEFRRDEDGRVKEEVTYDRAGQVVWAFQYTSPTSGFFKDARGFPRPRAGSGAVYVAIDWTPDGLEKEIRYLDRDNHPTPGRDGVYGQRQEFDERGLPVRITFLDAAGRPALNKFGWATITWQFDERGNLVRDDLLDLDGRPTLCKEVLTSRSTYTHDAQGNDIETAYFGTDGRPTLHKDGNHLLRNKYDERGNAVEWAYFGTDGKPTLYKNGYHLWRGKYDHRGNEIRSNCLGVNAQPILSKEGFYSLSRKYDERGNAVEWAYFGIDERPTLHRDGYHRLTSKYDERGYQIENAVFGLDGRPTLSKLDQGHLWTARYDDRGNQVELAYFGTDGKPSLHKDGYHRLMSKYDERGNQTEWSYFGADGKPTLHKDGYHLWTCRYDERGNQVEQACFGADGKPTLNVEGYHRCQSGYDERGNHIENSFFGVDGQRTRHGDGYHRWARSYDERGNVIRTAYFDVDRKPMQKDGYHGWAQKYDERGNCIENATFGLDGRPTPDKDGIVKWEAKYDPRGNEVERMFWGLDGKPVLNGDGYHRVRNRFDERGNAIESAYFGTDGKGVLTREGYHRVNARYDPRGNHIENTFFDVGGRRMRYPDGFHKWTKKYDDRGNRIEVAYFDTDGQPTPHKNGYARLQTAFNERNEQVDLTAFDAQGKQVALEAFVTEVTSGSQGARLGLQAGDLLLTYAGKSVVHSVQFTARRLAEGPGGPPRSLVVLREGRMLTLAVPPGMLGIALADRVATARDGGRR